jgi:ATP-dependent DNA ligase
MDLPVMPPVAPMLAKAVDAVPVGDYAYEPKWDGFRCIVFCDGGEVELGSRNERPLTRYFPDVVAAARAGLPPRCVVDGEIVVAGSGGLDFDLLSQRIHPAESRVRTLAERTPAQLVVWDLLALDGRDLRAEPFSRRRAELERAMAAHHDARVHLTPLTTDPAVAADWFDRFEGAGLDGVVAKSRSQAYAEDKRVMLKVKHERTAEFVVGGFRWYKGDAEVVGSLMLGLYDGTRLAHVGVIGSFSAARRRELVAELTPYRDDVGDHPWARWAEAEGGGRKGGGREGGGRSRWNAGKDLGFEPLRPDLVVEAAYEHLQGSRLRHTARFRRWRPDRTGTSCTYEQVAVAVPALLADVFAAGGSRRPDLPHTGSRGAH